MRILRSFCPDVIAQLGAFARSTAFRKYMRTHGNGDVRIVVGNSVDESYEQWQAQAKLRLKERLSAARAGGAPIHLRVFPDYCAFPVWDIEGGCSPEVLGLSAELASELTDWNRQWEDHHSGDPDAHAQQEYDEWFPRWVEEGRELSRRLAEEVGLGFEVEYRY